MEPLLQLTALLSAVNCVLLVAVLYAYYRNYSAIKSNFTIGLAIFALLFLIENLASLYSFFTMTPYFVSEMCSYAFSLTVLQTAAFAVLNWLTWR